MSLTIENERMEKLYEILAQGTLTREQAKKFMVALAESVIRGENSELVTDLTKELRDFTFVSKLVKRKEKRYLSDKEFMFFSSWVTRSKNSYARAYVLGANDGRNLKSATMTMKAANGRRLIGARTRDKVSSAALALKHLTKEEAAEILSSSSNIGLSTGSVRRLLSQLFPGDEW